MKTSELIKKLQEIDATVPFDADVVMGDDWQSSPLRKVYHEPPHTFLEFDTSQQDNPGTERQATMLAVMLMEALLVRHKDGSLSTQEAGATLLGLMQTARDEGDAGLIPYIIETMKELKLEQ